MKFDNEYPHFLPPKPGFAERVKDLVSQGVLVMPYINGSSADLNIPDFDKFGPHAIVDEAGGYRMHFYGETSGRLLSMCPTQEYWQNTISSLVKAWWRITASTACTSIRLPPWNTNSASTRSTAIPGRGTLLGGRQPRTADQSTQCLRTARAGIR